MNIKWQGINCYSNTGDFHFLWECLKLIFLMFWGTTSQPGSLCNVREYISRKQVDKEAKVFNVADEFLIHTFKSHLLARVCSLLKLTSPSSDFNYAPTYEWFQKQARMLAEKAYNLASLMTQHIIFIGHFYIQHFYMSISDVQSGGRTGLTSLGIGNYGFHSFWELGEKTVL